jgi:hypothetical protein
MDTAYLHPYHPQRGRDDHGVLERYPDHHHRHRHGDRPPRSHTSSGSDRRSQRSDRSDSDTDDESSDSFAPRRSRSVVRHSPGQSRSAAHSRSRSRSRTSSRGTHARGNAHLGVPGLAHGVRRPRSEDPAARKRYEHAIEKAIGAGSAAAFHMRSGEGAWVGVKGLKVVGAASAAALIDYAFDKDPKNHKARHIALSMMQSSVVEAILHGGEKGSNAAGLHGAGHGSHHRSRS